MACMRMAQEGSGVKEGTPGEVEHEVTDCRALPYDSGEFDSVINKGTLDTMVQADAPEPAHARLAGACRVLRQVRVFLNASYGDGTMRRSELERPELPWTMLFSDTLTIERATYFVYAYKKQVMP